MLNLPPCALAPRQDFHYLCASIANVSNFVSVKLSSKHSYCYWKTQMLCLMKCHDMVGLVDNSVAGPDVSSVEMRNKYDSLLKGWILGSVSEDVLGGVFNLDSAKDVWDKLKAFYDTASHQQGPTSTQHAVTVIVTDPIYINLHRATLNGDWSEAESILRNHRDAVKQAICNDGSTILHVAVGKGHKGFMKKLISFIDVADLLHERSSDKSTALHVVATVGNTYAAKLLVKKNRDLLNKEDANGQKALYKAYQNLHLDTIEYLSKEDGAGVEIGLDVLVNAISAKRYNLASKLITKFPTLAAQNDKVLMALTINFPDGLDYLEALFYPSFGNVWKRILSTVVVIRDAIWSAVVNIFNCFWSMSIACVNLSSVPKRMLRFVYYVVYCLILIICGLLLMLYLPFWKSVMIVDNYIEKKKQASEEAKKVLELVCDEIDRLPISASHQSYYARPILEAARQNADKVVDEILFRSPDAIQSIDESGYDIIQLAVLHRSVKIYNLIYDIGERKNLYKKMVDSCNNNILHLAGKLAPSHQHNQRSNPALQLQLELQWQREVKKLVFPTYITQENSFKEKPHMVFTREHNNLLKEGEKWMKSTAKSGSIIAALITTIVFAAGITVPGGSDQKTGIPLFTKEIAFIVFAISDSISLFASSTALLGFSTVLTARFEEKEFLQVLPALLLLGHCALLLSTIAMMVAFSATIFLVFCHQNLFMLYAICLVANFPMTFFVMQEFPIILNLYRSTFVTIFGKQRKSAQRYLNLG